jgi:hypothetical protein
METIVSINGGNPGGRSKYYLNDETTLKKLKKAAQITDFDPVLNLNNSVTINFSTGAYIVTALPLLKFWMEALEKTEGRINPDDTDSLDTKVTSVVIKQDKGDTIEGYIVKLLVEGEEVTITLYDTALKMLVQGGPQQVQYATRALIPHLRNAVGEHSNEIGEINTKVLLADSVKNGKRTSTVEPVDNTPNEEMRLSNLRKRIKFSCSVCGKTFTTRLDVKVHITNIHNDKSDLVAKKNARSIRYVKPTKLVTQITKNIRRKKLVLSDQMHDDSNLLEDDQEYETSVDVERLEKQSEVIASTPTPSPIKESGRSLSENPEVEEAAEEVLNELVEMNKEPGPENPPQSSTWMDDQPLDFINSIPKVAPSVPLCPEAASFHMLQSANQKPVIDLTASQRLIIPVLELEDDDESDFEELELLTSPELTSINPSLENFVKVPKSNVPERQKGDSMISLSSMTTQQVPDFTQLPGPSFANMGDYMLFICESVRSQSEMILRLENNERKQTENIMLLGQKVESMTELLHSNMSAQSMQPAQSSNTVIQLAQSLQTSAQSTQTAVQSTQTAVQSTQTSDQSTQTTAQSTDLALSEKVECTSSLEQRHKRTNKMKTLLVGDSIVHNINTTLVEREVGGLLFTPGLYGPGARTDRVYGSEYDSVSRYPDNNQRDKIPQLLQIREVDNLVLQASTTDITNLKKFGQTDANISEVYEAARKSSANVMEIAEEALKANTNLKKVVIMERPARFDELYDVSEYSNFVLRCLGSKSPYQDRLVVGEHSLYCVDSVRVARYGQPGHTRGYDGVHLRGKEGKDAFSWSVTRILQKAGISMSEWKVSSGRRSTSRQEVQTRTSGITTSNRFVLN